MQNKAFNHTEKEERIYFEKIKAKLKLAISETDKKVNQHAKEIQDTKDYLWDNKDGMDRMEKVAVRQSIDQTALIGENSVAKKLRLRKLIQSPYFGRIDFVENGKKITNNIYIGVHSFFDNSEKENIIHDWRAPISTMFYDFELGKAYFKTPTGKTKGEILLKRQYRIRQGNFEFMLENSMNIHDEVLQKELSSNSDEKMKNIVATIQRDQNLIIRNEKSQVLIIQGVAGSGKTSIALHRIAFLLYRFKETIKSKDILIISPNKVFADYISNVLPELGEEKIQEIGMEELAIKVTDNKFKFQTFFEQVSILLEKKDNDFINRISYKSTFDFINKLNEYIVYIENNAFKTHDIWIGKNLIPSWFIEERFKAYHRLPILKRFNEIVKDIEENIRIYYKYNIDTEERNNIRKTINKMFETTNLRAIYKAFYKWLDKPELFKLAKGSKLEYSDVYPLIYMKIKLEGIKTFSHVKHLLIDEMQDYTAIQYNIISKLFSCNKTILGDSNQAVNPHSSSNSSEIQKVFSNADCMTLNKSYRSTFEITEFAQKIHKNSKLETIKRHGKKPIIKSFNNEKDEILGINDIINDFVKSENTSLGIICKTEKQANKLFENLKDYNSEINILNSESVAFAKGVIITTTHMAKGLEFDHVIIPQCSNDNYKTVIDKYMLYIAVTRAMHILNITYTKNYSEFIR